MSGELRKAGPNYERRHKAPHTEATQSKKELPSLTTHNFVYHDLAIKHPEVCAFDIALLEHLVDRKVDHKACMAKGGHACRFVFKES